jgi:serine/threonine protein kinase
MIDLSFSLLTHLPNMAPRGSISEFSALSITDHSDASSDAVFQDVFNELDKNLNSEALLAKLSEDPSLEELFQVAAVRVREIIEGVSIEDRLNFAAIPHFSKTDVLIGKHLGKGTFSDVFEVTAMTATIEEDLSITRKMLEQAKNDLDRLIQANVGDNSNQCSDAFVSLSINKSSLLPQDDQRRLSLEGSESENEDEVDLEKIIAAYHADRRASAPPPPSDVDLGKTAQIMRRSSLCSSICVSSLQTSRSTRRVTLAMKCLRPAIRSNTEQFMIGVEDLVHETVMLSSLIHPNIIKVHGRSGGTFSSNLLLEDGYFILLDRLQDTIDNRISDWRKKYPNSSKNPPSIHQVKVAVAVADAMAFLHEKNIVFRDLKPANVGFDERGVVKLFDFGFAVKLSKSEEGEDGDGLLYDKAGTPRYMSPEVEFGMGYGLPADVYSFGILLWEIIALQKPFSKIKSAAEFTKVVLQNGKRPKLGKNWPQELNELLTDSWSTYPEERPSMKKAKRVLQTLQGQISSSSERSQRRSIIFK